MGHDESLAGFLGEAQLFSELPPEAIRALAQEATVHHVMAGAWLFHEDEAGDALYVVRSGRLEILTEDPDPRSLGTLGRGAILGELALLTGSPRSASVRALRDCEVISIERSEFERVLASDPKFALALMEILGRRLQTSQLPAVPVRRPPSVIAVMSLSTSIPVADICERVRVGLEHYGTVALVPSEHVGPIESKARAGEQLDRLEHDHAFVILAAGEPVAKPEWAMFCARQADEMVLLAGSDPPPSWIEGRPELQGRRLVVWADRPERDLLERTRHVLLPKAVHLIRRAHADSDARRLARRLARRAVGVVLSGGGARGLAHIGVIDELLRSGIEIDRIAGCSMGAFIGAQFALGRSAEEVRETCRREIVEQRPFSDYAVPRIALLRGRRGAAMLTRVFGDAWFEDASREFRCVSSNLLDAQLVVHDSGPIAPAIRASAALPGIAPPESLHGRLLVDGGVLDNLPIETLAQDAEGPVIGVDVMRPMDPGRERWRRPRARAFVDATRTLVYGVRGPRPLIAETLARSAALSSWQHAERNRSRADLLIAPEIGRIGLMEFSRLDELIEAGRRSVQTALSTGGLARLRW